MGKMAIVYLSQSLDGLVESLLARMEEEPLPPLRNRLILVPNNSIKQWLFLKIAERKGIAAGLKILPIQQGIRFLLPPFLTPSSIEMFSLVYKALSETQDPELLSYLAGNERRLLDLSEQLSTLFFRYGQSGEKLFEEKRQPIDWQHRILQHLFVEGPWRLPEQILPISKPLPLGPIFCFGIDYLPSFYWEFLFRSPSLSIFLFSPCKEFWEDLYTDRERRRLKQKKNISKKVLNELDTYLREAPSLLANWGKLGRENLKIFDRFSFDSKEAYLENEDASLLKKVQNHLLHFRTLEKLKIGSPDDRSIQVFLTGSSRMREVEILRDQILHLNIDKKIPFHEMSILAPNLEPYIPWMELLFTEPTISIPYRIQGTYRNKTSPFFQGLSRLIQLGIGRWDAEEVLALLEAPSFFRKQGRQFDEWREWIVRARIDWGIDEASRETLLSERFGPLKSLPGGSWEQGLDALLHEVIYLIPEGEKIDGDLLEEFLALFSSLQEDLAPLSSRLETLGFWADRLEHLAGKYLFLDREDEADSAANAHFRRFIQDLREADVRLNQAPFPFSVAHRFLLTPCPGQTHASYLHAVPISTLQEGALIPAKAVFMIGMDEDRFPRSTKPSSLNLLKQEKKTLIDSSDEDRYLFLQALFSAGEYLRLSYGHLSGDEGKPVGPSLLVQELLHSIDSDITVIPPSLSFDAKCFEHPTYSRSDYLAAKAYYGLKGKLSFWPDMSHCPELTLPEGDLVVSIQDLTSFARHPWKFYLQKIQGMFLHVPLEETFALKKSQCLRASLTKSSEKIFAGAYLPQGLLGKTLEMEIFEEAGEWQSQLKDWGVEAPFSLRFKENGRFQRKSGNGWDLPPLEIECHQRNVRLVGEIRSVTSKGFLHTSDEGIQGVIKYWPDILIASIALGVPQILLLKSGKIKTVEDPVGALQAYLDYYFRCLKTASPLLPVWADPFLRKSGEELENTIQTVISGRSTFEDPTLNWVLLRSEIPSGAKLHDAWAPYLREAFSHLISLYPRRAKKGEPHAEV